MPEYVKVAQASELEPNHGKLVEVQGKKLALFNVDGKFHAIDDTCTHRGGPLSEGELDGDEVTCLGTGPNSRSPAARCSGCGGARGEELSGPSHRKRRRS